MNYFFDFEFLEDGKTIDPISFGMVSEDNRELYLQFIRDEAFEARLTPWLRENVLPHLTDGPWVTKHEAATAILNFVAADSNINFWAYYADYDWVVLCQLFGTMMDLPEGWPRFCNDVKQLCDDLENPKLPEQRGTEHHALADARWTKEAWEFLQQCGRHAQRAPNHGNALTDVGPDFRVVSVRVLQSAYDRIDAMLASIEPDLRAANSVRIELRHLINERHTGAAVTSTEPYDVEKTGGGAS